MINLRFKILISILWLIFISPVLSWAQPDPPGGGPGGGDPPVGGSPLDEGLIFLLVFAGLYGLFILIRIIRRHKNRDLEVVD